MPRGGMTRAGKGGSRCEGTKIRLRPTRGRSPTPCSVRQRRPRRGRPLRRMPRRRTFPVAGRCPFRVPTSTTGKGGGSSTGMATPRPPGWYASPWALPMNIPWGASQRCARSSRRRAGPPSSSWDPRTWRCTTSTGNGRRSCKPTSACTCIPGGRGCRKTEGWWWGSTTIRTWCWRWTTRRTCGVGSWGCTSRGVSRRSGWRCRSDGPGADREVCGRG